MMADLSDDIEDLKKYHNLISSEQFDAIFGSRFLKESKIKNYPLQKLILNRNSTKFCKNFSLIE